MTPDPEAVDATDNPVDDELAIRKPQKGTLPPPPEGRLMRRDAHPRSTGWASEDQE
ncbi:MAG TPA: hypothetical protein VNZ52_11630 [Candidatus Thermoplasmatota archaeon]|nr:hypothetical protein [Candidatus Thermoplasmatota archaeon]